MAEAAENKSVRARREEEILKFWEDNKIFEKSLAKPAPRGDFVFYEGPPYANGLPGIHHLEARAFKDVILRYKTMRGFRVPRRAGWDTHGLPIEMAVEKKLGLTSKKDIETKVGIAKFVAAAKDNVFFYKAEWEKFTKRIGYWLDFEQAYLTMSANYIESLWWVIKQIGARQIDGQGLLYQDYKILPWCPRCGTALSSHELAQGYETVRDLAVTVKYKVVGESQVYFLVWTTTPWTLPGNVALAVGEKIDYVKIKVSEEFFILAKSRLSLLTAQYEIAVELKGRDLVGLKYEPLYNFLTEKFASQDSSAFAKAHRVYAADFVTTDEGTGIVHTAVMYGQDDFELGTKIGLPKYHLVDENGRFVAACGFLADKFVRDEEVAVAIIKDLAKRNLLFKKEKYEHVYPHCWRCQTPLIYYARDSWYIRMSVLRPELLKANEQINWFPAHIKHGRFGEWLTEAKDWAISRERYWGTPLPVWKAKSGKKLIIGSLAELKAHTKKSGNKYFVMRHGEAENNVKQILSSRAETPHHLTERGRQQTKAAAQQLKVAGIDLIVSSDFVRARETVEIVAAELGLKSEQVVYDKRLREVDHGDFDGQAVQNYYGYYADWAEHFIKDLPNGENFAAIKRRVGAALYDIDSKYQNRQVLIIGHSSPSWLLLAAARAANQDATIKMRAKGQAEFIDNAEVRPFDFVPLPHNEDYELDLHRPYIDEVVLVDEKGRELKRTPEVLDVWFDSGAMPWAQNHFPFAGKDIPYPADYIAEAIDQTRGWFYTLLAIGVLLERGAPYKNVICLGHILDPVGKKMSKSVGNVVDPVLMIDKYGVDALRFWMYAVNQPGDSKNFDETVVAEVALKAINLLDNVTSFYQLYGLPDEEAPDEAGLHQGQHILDRWLLARLAKLTEQVSVDLDNYRVTETARALRDFIADLSQWYLRRSRDRFRNGKLNERQAASAVLRLALGQLSRLLAPLLPFLAEEIYQDLRRPSDPESVHLTDWPEVGTLDGELMLAMAEVRRVVSLALEARARAGLKVRQPLAGLLVRGVPWSEELSELLRDEVNVKAVNWSAQLSEEIRLDTELTPELLAEGQLRDLVRQIQDLRKNFGLRPGELATLKVAFDHADSEFIRQQSTELKQLTNLEKIEFGDFTDASFFLSH